MVSAAFGAARPREFVRRRVDVRGATAIVALTAGGVAALLSALLLRDGIHMTPDSWAYWQGSVSLLEGRGYRYFFGDIAITHWPPLYPAYLAAAQALAGVSGSTLIATNVLLVGAASVGWLLAWWVPLRTFRDGLDTTGYAATLMLAIYTAAYTAHHFNALHAEGLRYALLPFFLLAVWRTSAEQEVRPFVRWTVLAALLGTALMLTHNASVAYVAAGSIVLAIFGRQSPARRLAACGVLIAVPGAVWLAVRGALGQGGSHTFGLEVAQETPAAYAWQMVSGIAYLIGPSKYKLSIAVLAAVAVFLVAALVPAGRRLGWVDARTAKVLRAYLTFGVAAALLTWAQFSSTWIQEPLNGRFVLFLPLVVVPALTVLFSRIRQPLLAIALCSGLALQPVLRLVERTSHPIDAYPHMALPGDSIDPTFVDRLPTTVEGRRLISPPLYPWTELVLRGVDQRNDSEPARDLKQSG
jgi:hypothetical protein